MSAPCWRTSGIRPSGSRLAVPTPPARCAATPRTPSSTSSSPTATGWANCPSPLELLEHEVVAGDVDVHGAAVAVTALEQHQGHGHPDLPLDYPLNHPAP